MENWKKFRDTQYSISDEGRLRNDRTGNITVGSLMNGYLCFSIRFENEVLGLFKIHRIVAESFILNPENKSQVNHKDGCKTNNRVDNLEWATPSENIKHAYATGLMLRGSKKVGSILTEEDIPQIIYYISVGYKDAEIANNYGVTRQTINAIRIGDNWAHLGLEAIGRYKGKSREQKLRPSDIPEIRARISKMVSDTVIAKDYNVNAATIRQIRIGATWKNY